MPQKLLDLNNLRLTATYYKVFCCLAKLIKVKSATLQRFQLAFKHLLLLEKNSRLHPIFQDFAFNFHTFSRSGKVVRKFPDFFKNSRLCTNPVEKKRGQWKTLKYFLVVAFDGRGLSVQQWCFAQLVLTMSYVPVQSYKKLLLNRLGGLWHC